MITFDYPCPIGRLKIVYERQYLLLTLHVWTMNNEHLCSELFSYTQNSEPAIVVGILPILGQRKESARRDKRPSSVYCVSVSCLYCIGQKHLLVGASLSTVCLYCVKHLLAYFQKHLLTYFRKHLLWVIPSVAQKQLSVYFRKQLLQKQLLPLTIEPSASHVIKYYKRILDIR